MTEERVRVSLRIKPRIQEMIQSMSITDNCHSQNEYIEKAIEFYSEYLMTRGCEKFLTQAVRDATREPVKIMEERIARLLFKMAVVLG